MRRTFKYKVQEEMEGWTNAFVDHVEDAEKAETDEASKGCMKYADDCLDRAGKLANILSATILLDKNP